MSKKQSTRDSNTQHDKSFAAQPSRRDALGLLGASLATVGAGAFFGCSRSNTPGNPDAGAGEGYDYIVIGAGSAGCPLVARLLELTGGSVLLVEAGGSNDRDDVRDFTQSWMLTLPGSEVDWAYRSVPQPALNDKTQSYSAGKVLGGSSSINGMVWARGHRGDYDRWAALGCPGWDYASVLASFKHIETSTGDSEFHGSEGPVYISNELAAQTPLAQAIVDSAVTMGYPMNPDYNGASSAGVGFTQLNVKNLVRQDAYTAFVKPHEDNPRLTIMTNTLAKKLIFDGNRRIDRVLVEQDGQERELRTRGEVIICAGTVNSAKLLLLSGLGPAAELGQSGIQTLINIPGVGKNLHDHLISVVVKELRQPEPAEHITAMDVSLFAGDTGAALGGAPRFQVQSYYMRYGWGPYPSEAVAFGSIHLHPTSRGSVTLDPANPQGPPIIDPRFLSTPEDMAYQLAGYRMIRELLNAPQLLTHLADVEYIPGPDVDTDDELVAAIRAYSEADFHPVGTCKMGVDSMAVVDPALRVHQVQGVRVAGAAVMPYITSGNTNAPSMMIGDRCGLLIAGAG